MKAILFLLSFYTLLPLEGATLPEAKKNCFQRLADANIQVNNYLAIPRYLSAAEQKKYRYLVSEAERVTLTRLAEIQSFILAEEDNYTAFMKADWGIYPKEAEEKFQLWMRWRYEEVVAALSYPSISPQKLKQLEIELNEVIEDFYIVGRGHPAHKQELLSRFYSSEIRRLRREELLAPLNVFERVLQEDLILAQLPPEKKRPYPARQAVPEGYASASDVARDVYALRQILYQAYLLTQKQLASHFSEGDLSVDPRIFSP